MEVREATVADADAIREVHRESIEGLGPEAYDDEQVAAWASGVASADYAAAIETGDPCFVVAEDGDAVLGFGSLRPEAPDGYGANPDAEVTGVYVRPAAARDGVGTAILAALERRAREAGADVLGLEASRNAVPFYDHHGYGRVRSVDHEFSADRGTGVEGTVVEMTKRL